MSIDRLESVGTGRFAASVGEGVLSFPSPADLTIEQISSIYASDGGVLFYLAAPEVRGITWPMVRATFDAWLAHHDMPEEAELRRLLWLVDRYADPIAVDLAMHGMDLAEMWRARRLRHLLLIVDALPTASLTREALHTDEDYAELVFQDQKRRKALGLKPDPRAGLPPLREHTPEVALLMKVVDGLRMLRTTLIAVNLTSGSPPKFEPEPRPWTAYQAKVESERFRASEDLNARLLSEKLTPGSD